MGCTTSFLSFTLRVLDITRWFWWLVLSHSFLSHSSLKTTLGKNEWTELCPVRSPMVPSGLSSETYSLYIASFSDIPHCMSFLQSPHLYESRCQSRSKTLCSAEVHNVRQLLISYFFWVSFHWAMPVSIQSLVQPNRKLSELTWAKKVTNYVLQNHCTQTRASSTTLNCMEKFFLIKDEIKITHPQRTSTYCQPVRIKPLTFPHYWVSLIVCLVFLSHWRKGEGQRGAWHIGIQAITPVLEEKIFHISVQ